MKRGNQGRGACPEEFEGSANVVKATSAAWGRQFTTPDGFVSLIGWLTASVSDTTMALVEDGALLGSRQLDMGNSGYDHRIYYRLAGARNRARHIPPQRLCTKNRVSRRLLVQRPYFWCKCWRYPQLVHCMD